jgi:hypothetical protein
MSDENATRGWVTTEVKRQMEPLTKVMEEKRQKAEQTKFLSEHAEVVDKFDSWRQFPLFAARQLMPQPQPLR